MATRKRKRRSRRNKRRGTAFIQAVSQREDAGQGSIEDRKYREPKVWDLTGIEPAIPKWEGGKLDEESTVELRRAVDELHRYTVDNNLWLEDRGLYNKCLDEAKRLQNLLLSHWRRRSKSDARPLISDGTVRTSANARPRGAIRQPETTLKHGRTARLMSKRQVAEVKAAREERINKRLGVKPEVNRIAD